MGRGGRGWRGIEDGGGVQRKYEHKSVDALLAAC